jgi:hypothetical protein
MYVELPKERYQLLHGVKELSLFPLITAVIYGIQTGKVFVDSMEHPKSFYIIHKSARSYFYTTDPKVDYKAFLDFIYSNDYVPQYFHIYNASEGLIAAAKEQPNINIRQRDRMRMRKTDRTDISGPVDLHGFTAKRIDEADRKDLEAFGISFTDIFWDSMEDFANTGIGWVIYDDGKPMTLWYAVCVANKNCESDLVTLPEFRGKGAATIAGNLLLRTLDEKGVNMDWDVFPDNIPSIKLAERYNYETYFEYQFLSIFKVKEGQ